MLYLLARCVKGAVRYGRNGKFNQSPDKRRHGTSPRKMRVNVLALSALMRGRATFSGVDYRDVFGMAGPGDLVYMDPPYQGVSGLGDPRYIAGVPLAEFGEALEALNRRNINFIVSYDGTCGGKEYGSGLPDGLGCGKFFLEAGPSTQATLLGKSETTFEALYVSRGLLPVVPRGANAV